MLSTPIGNFKIIVDENEIHYTERELVKKAKTFSVDRRVEIEIQKESDDPQKGVVMCMIDNVNNLPLTPCKETGEDLQIISFYYQNFKLSIGIKEIAETEYKYLDNGIQVKFSNLRDLKIYIAWLEMKDIELEDVFTWFAADPTL